ncbi:hypothetical protein OFM39_31535, partial [Escherichia coli]|nr:hypothetical protein [Escherichia coli]
MELSAACAERDGLRKEIEQLRQTSSEDLRTDDLRFQRESNADLAMQLKRSHESNIELVSVLQDLEE